MRAYLGLIVLTTGLSACASTQGGGGGRLPEKAKDLTPVAEKDQALGVVRACRPIDDSGRGSGGESDREAAPPAPGYKRFELRTGRGLDAMKISVEGYGTFVKDGASPEPGCVYVDLPPGVHRVRYHVIAQSPTAGLEARLRVSEYGETFSRWYRTFAFRCGNGQDPCSGPDAQDVVRALSAVPRGVHDPCGSTKVQGLHWFTERPADGVVSDFNLQFSLNIYRFAPRFPPDNKTCKGISYEGATDSADGADR